MNSRKRLVSIMGDGVLGIICVLVDRKKQIVGTP